MSERTAILILAVSAAVALAIVVVFAYATRPGDTAAGGSGASVGGGVFAAAAAAAGPRSPIPAPKPPRDARPIRDVRIVRLAVLPGQPEHAAVCGEIRLYDGQGRWIAPVSGYVRSVLPGRSDDWRQLTDNDPGTYVHTDARRRTGFTEAEAPNVMELHYPPGTEAARLVVWSRPDALITGADRMTNLEVSVLTPNGAPFRRTLFDGMATAFGDTQRYYDFDLRVA